MSTQNAANNQTEPVEKEEQTQEAASSRRTARANRSVESKIGDLVKASSTQEIIVLEDNTRLISTDYLPNHRPITASSTEVVGSLDSAGIRPIMADTLQVANSDLLPGHRPIAVSTLPVSDLHVLPGNRPIAPNDVVDPPASVLMGYLD